VAWLSFEATMRELRDGEIVVGSGADADWRVATADLMPRHFLLTVHGLNTSIRPHSADIVVVVNDKQILSGYHLLNDGDVISAGRGRFMYGEDAPRVEGVEPASGDGGFLVDDRVKVAYELLNRSTAFGRDASNSVVIADPRASRFHGEVRREAGGFALHSMGSSGTRLNGTAMDGPRLLVEGDLVEVAYTTFRFTRVKPGPDVGLVQSNISVNDAAGSAPTLLRERATMESEVSNTNRPAAFGPMRAIGLILLVVIVVAVGWAVFHR
jgi:predicted component of type VI protein secretion system